MSNDAVDRTATWVLDFQSAMSMVAKIVGEELDADGKVWGVDRLEGELDAAYRDRIVGAIVNSH